MAIARKRAKLFRREYHGTRGLTFALALRPRLQAPGVPILLRLTTDGGLATLLDAETTARHLGGLVRPFPLISLSAERELLLLRTADAGAIAIHEDYIAHRVAEGHDATNPALRAWAVLDEDFKDSNRQQADHHEVKLRALGLATAPASGPGEAVAALAPEEIETLARMEHARWNAERWLAGWTFAPGEKNAARKTSPWLVDYDALPDAIREYDREAVRNIPRLVQLSGRKIVRGA